MATEQKNPMVTEAGRKLRQMRLDRELTQKDIIKLASKRFGPENEFTESQLSRIEGGNFNRISLDDAVHYGTLLDLTPNQVAALYGLWEEREGPAESEPITRARHMERSLPEDLRTRMLNWIDLVVRLTQEEALKRVRGDESYREFWVDDLNGERPAPGGFMQKQHRVTNYIPQSSETEAQPSESRSKRSKK